MAIKGKKSKSRPKAPARAPRREVVEVPTPFFQRRAVQLGLAFIAGLLIFWFGIWLANGLHAEGRKNDAAEAAAVKTRQAAKQKSAVQSWKGTVDTAIGSIGTAPTTPGDPVVFTDLTAASASLAKGALPPRLEKTVRTAQSNAKEAEKALNAVDIPSKIIQGKGFDLETTNSLINSKSQMLLGLDLYAQSASLASAAANAIGGDRTSLAADAVALQASASQAFNDGWRQLQEALAAVGIFPTPPQGVGPTGGVGGLPGT